MKLAVLMDPIETINPKKDTTLAILLAAQQKGWQNFVFTLEQIWLQDNKVFARLHQITVFDDEQLWFQINNTSVSELSTMDLLFMRKDPPFNMDFLYLTYLLELVEKTGVRVVNKPSSLRDANEKLFTAWFPQCCPKTLVTSQREVIISFLKSVDEAVIKPLDSMGGKGIFRLKLSDHNCEAIIETATSRGTVKVMVQAFIPEILNGDKRVLMINGEPIPYALARIPAENDFRGNLAAGAKGEGRALTKKDRWICDQVGPTLKEKGLVFVGLDIIGDYLTEINVTSPTCIRELNAIYDLDIARDLLDAIE